MEAARAEIAATGCAPDPWFKCPGNASLVPLQSSG